MAFQFFMLQCIQNQTICTEKKIERDRERERYRDKMRVRDIEIKIESDSVWKNLER